MKVLCNLPVDVAEVWLFELTADDELTLDESQFMQIGQTLDGQPLKIIFLNDEYWLAAEEAQQN